MWDGVTRAATLKHEEVARRQQLADAARACDWRAVLCLLAQGSHLINSTRPDGRSWYTVLHQAAYGGAPVGVVEELLGLGAWRTLRTAHGERALDIAERLGREHLRAVLSPVIRYPVGWERLQGIQQHFHALIRTRAERLVREHALRLPELDPLRELVEPRLWFAVPGMYGGFEFWLDAAHGGEAVLFVESWSRVVGGSGQRHVVGPFGSLLLDEGFV